ncbi:hypothetical protein FSP39_006074 [Pinctada imbricata]|uniref:G-protein coupled receptors family 1 profile domain-containing protein n=1 Tax=Pinctada imbricata TaxID=66713 RepID=A0AA88YVK9_PINIB|nr:hypothetical protein FSP39_006074 [Pinctada imbricata]
MMVLERLRLYCGKFLKWCSVSNVREVHSDIEKMVTEAMIFIKNFYGLENLDSISDVRTPAHLETFSWKFQVVRGSPAELMNCTELQESMKLGTACITMSIMLSLPPLFGWAKYDYIPQQSFCFCDWSAAPSYAFFMIGCCFMTPLTVMAICNVFIFRSARRSNRNTQSFTTEASRDTRGDEIRLAFMLVVVVIVFVCSWLPYCISMVIGIYAPELVPRGFHMWTTLMGYSNSGANPYYIRGYEQGIQKWL